MPPRPPRLSSQPTVEARVHSPRQLSWLLLRDRAALEPDQQAVRDRLLAGNAAITAAHTLAQDFRQMVKEREPAALDPWLERVAASDLPDLQRFAQGLNRDAAAVLAALSLDFSNRPVEGHINRLKFIKRQGYGRAGFQLLKQRVLAA